MRITCLAENTSHKEGIQAEHGLSLYVETQTHAILFDMGQSDLFIKNAEALDIDLRGVDLAVLSHGHYDHGGGLSAFLSVNQTAPVYVSPYAFEPHYNAEGKYIGLDPSLSQHPRLIQTDEEFVIDSTLTLYHCNQKPLPYQADCGGMTVERAGERCSDDFRHEQYLLIREEGKTVLISGCSHKGILNIATWFTPQVLVGGFHWMKHPLDEALTETAIRLNRYDTVFYTGHCTGTAQFEWAQSKMERLFYLSAGETVEL